MTPNDARERAVVVPVDDGAPMTREQREKGERALVELAEQDDKLCPHGWPYEFCGNCHEDDERSGS